MADDARPVLAVDLDEVLGDFVSRLAKFHNEMYGTTLCPEDFHSYDFHEVWGGNQEETSAKMLAFFEHPLFCGGDGLERVKGAYGVLCVLKQHFCCHVVTSRQAILQDLTRAWLDLHFPECFDGVHFGNHYAPEGTTAPVRSKGDMCNEIGAVAIVDDSLKYIAECRDAGIDVLLFGNYAWNQPGDDMNMDGVRRVAGWYDVYQALSEMPCGAHLPTMVDGQSSDDFPVVSIAGTRTPMHYASTVLKALETHPVLELRGLGSATANVAEVASVVERRKYAETIRVKTGWRTGSRNSQEAGSLSVRIACTPDLIRFYVDQRANAAASDNNVTAGEEKA